MADRGAEAMAKTLRKPLPEDVEFMHASRDEMQNLKKSLQPLTRKLAARLARKRRHGRKGPLDFRNTVRHSLAYGGVPAEPKFKYPRPAKPELIVIADISGSVASGKIGQLAVPKIIKFGTEYGMALGYEKNNPASVYYDFVNKGVKGVGGKNQKKKEDIIGEMVENNQTSLQKLSTSWNTFSNNIVTSMAPVISWLLD